MCSHNIYYCSHITVILVIGVVDLNYSEFKQYYLITLLVKIPLRNSLVCEYSRLSQRKARPEVI